MFKMHRSASEINTGIVVEFECSIKLVRLLAECTRYLLVIQCWYQPGTYKYTRKQPLDFRGGGGASYSLARIFCSLDFGGRILLFKQSWTRRFFSSHSGPEDFCMYNTKLETSFYICVCFCKNISACRYAYACTQYVKAHYNTHTYMHTNLDREFLHWSLTTM